MHGASHHTPPRPAPGFVLAPQAFARVALPTMLQRGEDGGVWLPREAAGAFVDWAWRRLDAGAPAALVVAVGLVVCERLRVAPEVGARFEDAERLATQLVARIAPGRDRFHDLYRALSDGRTPADRALHVALLLAGIVRQRALARVSQIQLVLAGLCLDLGALLLPDVATVKMRASHPHLSADLLGAHGIGPGLLRAGVSGHHERMDGQGTPVGVLGEALPLAARLTGLCDRAVDALTPPPVGPALPRYLALERLADDRGAHDPAVLVDLVRLFARRDPRW